MSLISNFARSVKVELIAKLATSYEAYDGGTLIKGVAAHNIRDYFRKYGNTARKFDHVKENDIYIGYVRMSGKPEFLSAIALAGDNAVAVSFDFAVDESNDFLTLMAKKEFADRMTLAVRRASALMKEEIRPRLHQPQATKTQDIRTPNPHAHEEKVNIAGLFIIVCFSLVCAGAVAIFIAQITSSYFGNF